MNRTEQDRASGPGKHSNHEGTGKQRPPQHQGPEQKPGPGQSGMVTAVGVVSVVFGGVKILLAGVFIVAGFFLRSKAMEVAERAGFEIPDAVPTIVGVIGMILILTFVVVPALLQLIGGIGVLGRHQWGRVLVIIFGVLDIFYALPNLLSGNLFYVGISGGYGLFVLTVLLSEPYCHEFD